MRVESAAGLALCRPVAGGLRGVGGSVHQVECLVEWQGSCEQEALSERAAEFAEGVELCSGFDAFGDHADVERFAEFDGGADDRGAGVFGRAS